MIFSSNKGYHVANRQKESPHGPTLLNKTLVSNGFDCLLWSGTELKESAFSVDPIETDRLTTDISLWDLPEPRKPKKREKRRAKKAKKVKLEPLVSKEHEELLESLYREISTHDRDASNELKVIKFDDITVTTLDVDTLVDDEWLNDGIISFVYKYLSISQVLPTLTRRIKYMGPEKVNDSLVLLLPTFSFLLCNHPEPTELKDVLPNMADAAYIFLPVNDNDDYGEAEGGSHWSLVVFCPPERTAYIYNTMVGSNIEATERLIDNTAKLLGIRRVKKIQDSHTPQQINNSDCGILTCSITALLVDRIINVPDNTTINMDLENVELSALDARIFVMGTICNLMEVN